MNTRPTSDLIEELGKQLWNLYLDVDNRVGPGCDPHALANELMDGMLTLGNDAVEYADRPTGRGLSRLVRVFTPTRNVRDEAVRRQLHTIQRSLIGLCRLYGEGLRAAHDDVSCSYDAPRCALNRLLINVSRLAAACRFRGGPR